MSWGQARVCAGGEQGADPYLPLPPPSHPDLSHLNFSTSLCTTTLFPPTPTTPALTHRLQNFEDDVYKLRGTCILQPGGQPSLRTQGEACHQSSSHPTFTRTPGPHNCSGPWWGAWHSPKVTKSGEGRFQGEKLGQHGMSMKRRENRIAARERGGGKKSWETCGESRTRRLKLYLIFWKQSM